MEVLVTCGWVMCLLDCEELFVRCLLNRVITPSVLTCQLYISRHDKATMRHAFSCGVAAVRKAEAMSWVEDTGFSEMRFEDV